MTSLRIRRTRQTAVRLSVRAIGPVTKRADTSRQIHQEDAFTLSHNTVALQPPYDPSFLYNCVERSNMLKQCISAMVTNVALTGFSISPTRADEKVDPVEREELQSFLDAPNSEESLTAIHAKVVEDYETYGYGFIEVIRDRKKRISLLRHASSFTTRLTQKEEEPQLVQYDVMRGTRRVMVSEYRCFRRFVQIVNGKMRYFREFGDMRDMNMDTGEYGATPAALQATEIIHVRQNSNDPYGVPRWINQLPAILGSRESEECNLRYFEDNTVPPMILSVAGGRLTGQSYREMSDILTKQSLGKERQNKILLIEAVPEREGLDDKGTVTLKIDKLTDARQSDGLFKEYDEGNQAKIRSSFRLPPVAVGLSQDVTFATANVSAFIAESQVYLPQRNIFDEIYNKRIVNSESGLGLVSVQLTSSVPMITNSETLVKSLTALNVMGAVTPRTANEAANKILQIDIPEYPKKGAEGYEEWMDAPIALALRGSTANTQNEQSVKDTQSKQIEDNGDVAPKSPENGQQ